MNRRKAAAVVLNYGDPHSAFEAIDAALKAGADVFAVDNDSPQDAGRQLSERYSDNGHVTVLRSPVNRGYAAGNNLGLQAAAAAGYDTLLVVNPDAILTVEVVASLVSTATRPGVGVAGVKILDDEGQNRTLTRLLPDPWGELSMRRPFDRLLPSRRARYANHAQQIRGGRFAGVLSGCCFAISRDTWDNIGGALDEGTFLYYEEALLAERLAKTGRQAYLDSSVTLLHRGAVTTRSAGTSFINLNRYLSQLYLLRRLPGSRVPRLLLVVLNAIVATRWLKGGRRGRRHAHLLWRWQVAVASGRMTPQDVVAKAESSRP